jgi:ribonuclease P protein component
MNDPARVTTKPERLRRRAEYVAVAKGRRSTTPAFTLQGAERKSDDPEQSGPRFGLTVSRKVGTATERNRVKRRLREVLRRMAGDPNGSPGRSRFDYVVVARREILSAPFDRLVVALADAVRGLHEPRRDRRRPPPHPPAATG